MTVTLTPADVEQIVRRHLSEKFTTVGEVNIEVDQELKGHYTNEHYEPVFTGITCEVEV